MLTFDEQSLNVKNGVKDSIQIYTINTVIIVIRPTKWERLVYDIYGNVAVHRNHRCSRDFHCKQSHSRCTLRCHTETCHGKLAPQSLQFTSKQFTF